MKNLLEKLEIYKKARLSLENEIISVKSEILEKFRNLEISYFSAKFLVKSVDVDFETGNVNLICKKLPHGRLYRLPLSAVEGIENGTE